MFCQANKKSRDRPFHLPTLCIAIYLNLCKNPFLIRLSSSGNKSGLCFLNCFFKLFMDVLGNYSAVSPLCMGRANLFHLEGAMQKVSFICDSHIPHIIRLFLLLSFPFLTLQCDRLNLLTMSIVTQPIAFFQVNNVNFNLPFVCCSPQEDNSSLPKASEKGQHNKCADFQIL